MNEKIEPPQYQWVAKIDDDLPFTFDEPDFTNPDKPAEWIINRFKELCKENFHTIALLERVGELHNYSYNQIQTHKL